MAKRILAAPKQRRHVIPADVQDRLDIAIAVVQTVVRALHEENDEALAVTLLECGLMRLLSIRSVLASVAHE